jgi:type II secretory pathway pseudopilin PulG
MANMTGSNIASLSETPNVSPITSPAVSPAATPAPPAHQQAQQQQQQQQQAHQAQQHQAHHQAPHQQQQQQHQELAQLLQGVPTDDGTDTPPVSPRTASHRERESELYAMIEEGAWNNRATAAEARMLERECRRQFGARLRTMRRLVRERVMHAQTRHESGRLRSQIRGLREHNRQLRRQRELRQWAAAVVEAGRGFMNP